MTFPRIEPARAMSKAMNLSHGHLLVCRIIDCQKFRLLGLVNIFVVYSVVVSEMNDAM